jgi:type IV pilus assembly protein PilM
MSIFSGRNLIGVDIGSYSIKLVRLKGGPGSYTLDSALCLRLPGEGAGRADISPGFLSGLLKSRGMRGQRAATAFSGPSLVFRHMYLPPMPDKDLKEAVAWEMRKESAMPAGDMVTDYVLTGNVDKASPNNKSIIAFAARKAEVERLLSLFGNAGVDLRVIDVAPTALLSSFDANDTWEEGVNYAALDIGDARTTLAVFKNRRLAFARELAFGGSEITRSIATGLGKGETEAEEHKMAWGLLPPGEGGEEARRLVSAPLEGLCAEVHRSFDFYQAQFREGPVAKLFLSGGTARLKGIDAFVTEMTGIASFTDDPLRRITMPGHIDKQKLRALAPCLTIATGLCAGTTAH